MADKFKSPYSIGSSAPVESDFGDLKKRILRYEIQPVSIDRIVIKHLQAINNSTKLFRSSQLQNNTSINNDIATDTNLTNFLESSSIMESPVKSFDNKESSKFTTCTELIPIIKNNLHLKSNSDLSKTSVSYYSSDTDIISDTSEKSCDAVENWRGKGIAENVTPKLKMNPKKKFRLTKYMQPMPEIERVINRKNTRCNLNSLLINGNTCTPLKISKTRYMIHNTFPFDTVASTISMAYLDYPTYMEFVDKSDNVLLKFCKYLALNGASKKSYIERINILKNIFKEVDGITHVKIIDAKCNVSYIITQFLKSAPSAVELLNCQNTLCTNTNRQEPSPTIIPRIKTDLTELEICLNNYVQNKVMQCSLCQEQLHSKIILQNHLFIEMDIFADERYFTLFEILSFLNINNKRYVPNVIKLITKNKF